jgi:PhnB protein
VVESENRRQDADGPDPRRHPMAVLNPYLQFDGNARQAMETYRDVFGGELNLNTFGEFGAAEHEGAPMNPDGIMHAQLTTDLGFTLMASDLPPGMEATGNGSISVSGDEGDVLRGYFEKLADGGQVAMPLEKQMWGDEFGMCTDRYGVTWMVNIGSSDSQ